MNTELSDEQLGRLWCERHGKRPDYVQRGRYPFWRWVYDDGPEYALPLIMIEQMRGVFRQFTSEAAAYSAVGSALREMHRRAGEIAAVLGGVI